MSRIFTSIVLALAVAAVPLEAVTCHTQYRITQDGNHTFYKHRDVIFLSLGDKVDFYVHAYPSRSEHPYGASADIGAPKAFGVGTHRSKDVERVLRLSDHDPARGKISLTAIAVGRTGLGYQITDVRSPGRLDKVRRECRIGEVKVTVRDSAGEAAPVPAPAPSTAPVSANDAAHQLIVQLYTGILRRGGTEARDYPDSFFEQVQRSGLEGLVQVAQTMTASPEFRGHSLARTSQALERAGVSTRGLSREVLESQLLTDIFADLYGGSAPYGTAQHRIATYLSDCISGREGNDACPRLGRELLNQPQYQQHNQELLRYLR